MLDLVSNDQTVSEKTHTHIHTHTHKHTHTHILILTSMWPLSRLKNDPDL